MDKTKVLQQGTVGKYAIDITRAGFDMNNDDFKVILSYGFQNGTFTIEKKDMLHTEEDKWIFTFQTDQMLGVVTATCTVLQPDIDMEKGFWKIVDRQRLCFVATDACPTFACGCKECENHNVLYKQIYDDGSVHDGDYLLDVNYIPLMASGMFLTATK